MPIKLYQSIWINFLHSFLSPTSISIEYSFEKMQCSSCLVCWFPYLTKQMEICVLFSCFLVNVNALFPRMLQHFPSNYMYTIVLQICSLVRLLKSATDIFHLMTTDRQTGCFSATNMHIQQGWKITLFTVNSAVPDETGLVNDLFISLSAPSWRIECLQDICGHPDVFIFRYPVCSDVILFWL